MKGNDDEPIRPILVDVGLPRYMAVASVDDVERSVWLADELVGAQDKGRSVCLLQIGPPSLLAGRLSQELRRLGRHTVSITVADRQQAQADSTLGKLAGASAIWVFTEDLFETFFSAFATQLAFRVRSKAQAGLPVVGIGGGAMALGGLLLANRICRQSQFELVSGLGWAPRVLVDGGALRLEDDGDITHSAVRSLPGLLGIDLGESGGVRVEGSRIESVGSEPVWLLGNGGDDGSVLLLELEPGKMTTIAPPPFVPFEPRLLPPAAQAALIAEAQSLQSKAAAPARLREAPSPPETKSVEAVERDGHAKPGSGRHCPMCKQIHGAEAKLELAA